MNTGTSIEVFNNGLDVNEIHDHDIIQKRNKKEHNF